jgi:hypothetical protein
LGLSGEVCGIEKSNLKQFLGWNLKNTMRNEILWGKIDEIYKDMDQ